MIESNIYCSEFRS